MSEYRGVHAERPMVCGICQEVGGPLVECVVCRRSKTPLGRSVADEEFSSYCFVDCEGRYQDPQAGCLWPGERYGKSLGHMDWHPERAPARPARTGDRLDVPCVGVREGLNGCCAKCDDTGTIRVTLTEDPVHTRNGWQVVGTTEAHDE